MSKNKIYGSLSNFEIVNPKYFLKQSQIIKWSAETHLKYEDALGSLDAKANKKDDLNKIFERFSCSEEKISQRGFEVPDPLQDAPEHQKLLSLLFQEGMNEHHSAHIGDKAKFFLERSGEIFEKFYPKDSLAPDQLIHVTCTGYVSPSAAQLIVEKNNWRNQTGVSHAYHMGCYASIPAIRIGEGFVKAEGYQGNSYQVDIVHTEMCSLHMNPRIHTPEQIVIQSLFADGHIKYSLTNNKPKSPSFKIEAILEFIIPNSSEMMTWSPTFWGMDMTLSRKVPGMIRDYIKPFVASLVEKTPYELGDVLKNAVFAVHPGGPKIIEEVQNTLELNSDQVAHSQEVLLTRGNMSSATLPHVWKSIIEDENLKDKVVVSLAFGPGLTVFGSIFTMEL